jgi:hypothetical protein
MGYASLPDRFKEDLTFLWDFPDNQRRAFLPYIANIYKTETPADRQIAIEKALKEIGGNADENLTIINLLLYIYSSWDPMRDIPSNFIRDLEDLHLLPVEKRDETLAFLLEFFSIIEADNTRRLKKIFAGTLLPSYVGIETIVDFRPIIKQPYDSIIDRKIEDYNPECVDFIPIILIKLERDLSPKTFEFQCEEHEIDILIESLQAVKKDLEVSKNTLFERRDAV